MSDIWKSVIEHILSWPVAALFLSVIFRKPLTDLLGRINHIKAPGVDVSAPATAQIESKSLPTPDFVKGEIGSTSPQVAPNPSATSSDVHPLLVERREAVRNFGTGSKIIDEQIGIIKNQLAALNMPLDSEETGEILVRHLAATQLFVRCERTHRLIFGSQIAALHLMNTSPQSEHTLRAIFENARAQEPQFYASTNFEDWIEFLKNELAVTKTDKGLYAITVYGRHYLEYIGLYAPFPMPH